MANKQDTQNALRTLSTQFPSEAVNTSLTDEIVFSYNTGWSSTSVNTGFLNMGFVYKINTWDLSGYSLQDKTLFPQACMFQDLNVTPSGGSNIGGLTRLTIVSTTPLNEANLTDINPSGMWNTPGSMGSTFNLDHIIRARLELYQQDSTLSNTLIKTGEKSWGTGDSTASDRIWVAEVYMFTLTETVTIFYIPNSAVVMPSLIGKEDELEYFMRLSRSIDPVY